MLLTCSYYLKSQFPPLVYDCSSGTLKQMREQFDSAFTACAILSMCTIHISLRWQ